MKKLMIIGIAIMLIVLSIPTVVYAKSDNGVPYETFTEDSRHRLIPSQTAYIPFASYAKLGDYDLKSPEDIFIDSMSRLYIADSGNGRILVVEPNLTEVRVIGEGLLIDPTGVFVDLNELIYVADFGNEKVVVFNQAGDVVHEITKPLVPMFGEKTPFRPSKIAGDSAGNLYIVSEGTFQGLIQFDNTGEFLGFFGANPTKPDIRTIVLKSIFSDEIIDQFIKVTPQTMAHVAVDGNDRVYTVTRGSIGNAIKRLNISGINRLSTSMTDGLTMSAIAIGPIGNIYTVGDDCFIREYDAEGNLLFQFGGRDNRSYQTGLFNTPSGIAVDQYYNLYVIDKAKNELQVFIPTDFSRVVHVAVDLYQKGYYLESKGPWESVLHTNALFDLAHKGIGHAFIKEGLYEEAMASYQQAGYREGYSDAFWEVRNAWLTDNLSLFIYAIGLLYIVSLGYRLVFKQKLSYPFIQLKEKAFKIQTIREIGFVGRMIKHPLDGFYEIKKEHKVSIGVACFMYVVLFAELMFSIFYEGASFNTHELATVSLANQFISFLGPLLLFVGANYLVGAVNSGEGKLKDVFIGTIYALSPMIVFWPLVIILSRGLTLNEVFLYQALMFILIAWSVILGFFMIKDIHNYSIGQTVKSIVITLFTVVMIVVSFVLLSSLAEQAFNFLLEVFREVFLRG